MTGFNARKTSAALGVAVLIAIGSGCATKKHVRQVVGPVEARVSQTEQRNTQQQAAIGELNNSVSRADERAQEANQAAQAADQRARSAGDAAQMARSRADEGYTLADSTRARLGEFSENIDNYKMLSNENVLFLVGKSNLTDEAKKQLDTAVTQLHNSKNFIMEVQGFTDSTGDAAMNLDLSRKRADAVVRYLTSKHNVPLRRISMLGLGEDDPTADNKTRTGRKQARRVEIRVYSRDLGGNQNAGNTDMRIPRTTGSAAPTDPGQPPATTTATPQPQQP